jgi:outer membrane protein TolC
MAATSLLCGTPAMAQGASTSRAPIGHLHEPLEIDPQLTWDAVLSAALDIHPQRFELAAREEMAAAWQQKGANLLAGAPAIVVATVSDRALDNRGQSEFEGGVEMPLWRLGQKAAAQAVAASSAEESAAAAELLRLEVAGLLRNVLWDIAVGEQTLHQAEDALTVTSNLLLAVEARAARGDLPQADVLLARSARLERSVAVVESEALMLDAERSYRSLTGLGRRPENFSEIPSDREDPDASHPALASANRGLERARAGLGYVEKTVRGSPRLTIGPRRQRDPIGTFYNESVVAELSLPFGGRRHGSTESAAAMQLVAAAESLKAAVERQLDLEIHEAEHELYVIEESLDLIQQQAELAERRLSMSRTAFELGEINLQELLRVQDAAINATGAAARLRIERQRAVAAVNQALGEMP